MKNTRSKLAGKAFVVFLVVMLICTGICRGMASITTPKVKVANPSAQELSLLISGNVQVKEGEEGLSVTISQESWKESLAAEDHISLMNLTSFMKKDYTIDTVIDDRDNGVVKTNVSVEPDYFRNGDSVYYTLKHNIGNAYTCVPLSAVRISDNNSYVLVLETKKTILGDEYIAKDVSVKVDKQDDNYASISGNIKKDDMIIVETSRQIEKGDVVRLAEKE